MCVKAKRENMASNYPLEHHTANGTVATLNSGFYESYHQRPPPTKSMQLSISCGGGALAQLLTTIVLL